MSVYELQHAWEGSTADEGYPKTAHASARGHADIPMSAGATYGGDLNLWNPEDTLGAALAQCHTLTFLALAHKVGLDVRRVETRVEVHLESVERIHQVTRCVLRSVIHLAAGHDADKAVEMYGKAHRYCFIAASLKGEVETHAEVVEAGA